MRSLIRKQVQGQECEKRDAHEEEGGMVPSMDGVDSKASTFIEIKVGRRAEDVMGGYDDIDDDIRGVKLDDVMWEGGSVASWEGTSG